MRQVDPNTGAILRKIEIDREYFAEGMTVFTNAEGQLRLIQITWREQKGWIRDPDTLEVLQEFTYTTTTNQGWGITYNAATQEFIVSDGSNQLHFWDRDMLQEKRKLAVVNVLAKTRSRNRIALVTTPEDNLNELELLEDGRHVLADVFETDRIVKIDITSGTIVHDYDFATLERQSGADVLNGISTTGVEGEYYVTGKDWDTTYRVKLLI